MKKQYIIPEIEVVKLRMCTLLSGSLTGDYVKTGDADDSENLSHGSDFDWDDDEY